MAYEDPRAPGKQPVDGFDHFALGGFVDGRCSLVEHQNQRILQQRPGNRDPLFLSAGQLLTALAQWAVEAFG